MFVQCVSVCVCLAGGRGQVKEVAPGWSVVVRHNRWKVRTYSSGPVADPSLLIVEDAQAIAGDKWSIRRPFAPNRFPIDPRLTGPWSLRTEYLWSFGSSGSSEISPRLLATLVGLHIFPFCIVLMPGPQRQREGDGGLLERGSLCIDKRRT